MLAPSPPDFQSKALAIIQEHPHSARVDLKYNKLTEEIQLRVTDGHQAT
jgi:hypothetical protein